MTVVVGLDLSLTSTGFWRSGVRQFHADHGTLHSDPADSMSVRLDSICRGLVEWIPFEEADLVVIEDLPTNAKSAGKTGMVHGAVRLLLYRSGVATVTVPPASLKKFATGKGNCGKPEMAVAAFKRLGFEHSSDDVIDARWLAEMGLHHVGEPTVDLPKVQTDALGKVEWP